MFIKKRNYIKAQIAKCIFDFLKKLIWILNFERKAIQSKMNNENIQIIIEEAIAVPEGVAVGDYIEAVGVSILEYEYPDEEIEIEYVKQVMRLRVMVERFIEDPEDFCRPCELPNGDISNPLGELFEGFEDLEQTRFGSKIINRMELIAGGTNPILRTQMTEAEKQTKEN